MTREQRRILITRLFDEHVAGRSTIDIIAELCDIIDARDRVIAGHQIMSDCRADALAGRAIEPFPETP